MSIVVPEQNRVGIASVTDQKFRAPSMDGVGEGIANGAAMLARAGAGYVAHQRALGEADAEEARRREEEAKRTADFARQTDIITFGAQQSQSLLEQSRSIEGPGVGFRDKFLTSFDQHAQQWLATVPEDERAQWTARMAAMRSETGLRAQQAELGANDAFYRNGLETSLEPLANAAMQSPTHVEQVRQQGRDLIAASGLPAQEKAERLTKWDQHVSISAATGDIALDPQGAIARLGGVPTIERRAGEGGGAGYSSPTSPNAQSLASKFIAAESGGNPNAHSPVPGQTASGLGGFTDRTWLDTYKQHIGARGQTDAQILALKTDPTIGRRMTEYAVQDEQAFLKSKNLPVNDANTYLVHFLGPTAERLLRADPNAPASSVLPASFITANASVLRGKTVGQVQSWAARKMGGQAVASPNSGVAQGPASAGASEAPPIDPRYATLPAEARAQLIGMAQRKIDSDAQAQARAQQQQHADWLNSFELKIHDGHAGQADIEAARKRGILTDADEITHLESAVAAREAKNADINRYNMLAGTPGFQWNTFDPDQRKAVEAAVAAQGGSPMAAFNVWQKTGVLAKSGAVALRGGLVSVDPTQVGTAANIAGNMIRRNPNAFAGVEGREDIERAAVAYNHYVYDLGMPPQQAASRVAKENDPQFKAKVHLGQPERDQFMRSLRQQGLSAATALGGQFYSTSQAQEADQTYAELTVMAIERGADPASAQAQAKAQMARVYGVTRDGHVTKYAPERGYPPVAGSHDYVYHDAAATVLAETHLKPKQITGVHLVPIPGVTDQDFRAGRPPRYSLLYGHVVDGQTVYNTVPGQWAADVHAATVAATKRHAQQFAAEQARRDVNVARLGRSVVRPDSGPGSNPLEDQ